MCMPLQRGFGVMAAELTTGTSCVQPVQPEFGSEAIQRASGAACSERS